MLALVALAALAHRVPPRPATAPERASARTIAAAGPVDVNRASADELATLPRVGPTLAQRIVEDRAAHGPFATLGDLYRVPGLGPATIREIAPHATVGDQSGNSP